LISRGNQEKDCPVARSAAWNGKLIPAAGGVLIRNSGIAAAGLAAG